VLSDEIKDIYHRFKEPVKMAYGEKERENFEKSKWCLLCEKGFHPPISKRTDYGVRLGTIAITRKDFVAPPITPAI